MLTRLIRSWFSRQSHIPALPYGQMRGFHRERIGATAGFGSYHLVSFDEGKTWWLLSPNRAWLSPAPEGLVAELDGWATLMAHVEKHGPIGSRPLTADDTAALAGAGFSIRT